jgi:hypothetical protein
MEKKLASWPLAAALALFSTGALAQGSALVWQSRFDPLLAPGVEYPNLYGSATPSSSLESASSGDFYFYALDRLGI